MNVFICISAVHSSQFIARFDTSVQSMMSANLEKAELRTDARALSSPGLDSIHDD